MSHAAATLVAWLQAAYLAAASEQSHPLPPQLPPLLPRLQQRAALLQWAPAQPLLPVHLQQRWQRKLRLRRVT